MVFDHLLSEHELYIPLYHSRFAEICQGNGCFVYNSFTDKGEKDENGRVEMERRVTAELARIWSPLRDEGEHGVGTGVLDRPNTKSGK